MNSLINKVQKEIAEAGGTWSIVLEDLNQQKHWATGENTLHYAASIIKLPIMATVFTMADDGLLNVGDKMTLKRESIVGGSGVLQHLMPGLELSIYDLVTLMIIQSDNTATNMLIEKVGTEQVQATMKKIGMGKSSFYNKLMTVPVNVKGNNRITAHDISLLLKKMVEGKISSYYACEQMINLMKTQQIHYLTSCFPEQHDDFIGTAPNWMFASKTGSVTNVKHDVGVLYVGERIMTVTVLSSDCERDTALSTLDEIGRAIFRYLAS